MTKIDKIDLENINLIKKELKLKNVSSIKIKKGNYEIELSSSSKSQVINTPILNSEDNKLSSSENKISIPSKDENTIKSPMVGVAYLSADPQSPAYIKIGQHVKQGDTVLLIEAMKTFNEVKAPRSGIVKKINVLNSQPVEYGDDLIILE
jgi:acetyl-CoA carboxylase biotin carboxyl carrier protein|tara:strand:- start:608 stop:1057 length:450 start_codon:yes stop_codon:yes gene_type:complete